MNDTYAEKAKKRIAHVRSHAESGLTAEQIERAVKNIETNSGSPSGSAMNLRSNASAKAMYAWFGLRDIKAMRQWCYVAAKLDQLVHKLQPDTSGPGGNMLRLLDPLLTNCDSLVDWFAKNDNAFDLRRVENQKTHDFWAYQAFLSLRGEWDRLAKRCERVISDPPKASAEQKYLDDHHFYLALARGDVGRMEEVLRQLVEPKRVKARSNNDSGFVVDLISTAAVIYAKIAWRSGYKIKIDSPYVPVDWLPLEPLDHYDNHYSFLK